MYAYLKHLYQLFCFAFFDPRDTIDRWRGFPYYIQNLQRYKARNRNPAFGFFWRNALYTSFDRFRKAGKIGGHYFWQDLWAAKHLFANHIQTHVDVGSRLDGFITHLLVFCRVIYIDLRPLDLQIDGLEFKRGSMLEMPFADNSVMSLSSLHVLEHIGLGRYGDPVLPDGYLQAAQELVRVLAPGGRLLLGTPVGQERVCFDAHRVFDPVTILNAFRPLRLKEFALIDDRGSTIIQNATIEQAQECRYGCGLFVFEKEGVC